MWGSQRFQRSNGRSKGVMAASCSSMKGWRSCAERRPRSGRRWQRHTIDREWTLVDSKVAPPPCSTAVWGVACPTHLQVLQV